MNKPIVYNKLRGAAVVVVVHTKSEGEVIEHPCEQRRRYDGVGGSAAFLRTVSGQSKCPHSLAQ